MIKVGVENRPLKARWTGILPPETVLTLTLTGDDCLWAGEDVFSLLEWPLDTPKKDPDIPEGILIEREPLVKEITIYQPPNGPEVTHTVNKVNNWSTLDIRPATQLSLDYLTARLRNHWEERNEGEFSEKKIKGLKKVETIFERDASKKFGTSRKREHKSLIPGRKLQSQ